MFFVAEDQARCLILLHERLQIIRIMTQVFMRFIIEINDSRRHLIIVLLDRIHHL